MEINMKIINDLLPQFELYQKEYEAKALEVLRSGWYILGKEVELKLEFDFIKLFFYSD